MLSGGIRTKGIIKHSQDNLPLITVVTVVRNGEKTLEETILSVINQTYANVEYIIVDGASTDGTLDIIKKYDDRIDYWISEPDPGIYFAMNKGIDLTTGEWVNFMNAGDSFFSKFTVDEYVQRCSAQIPIIYGDMQLILRKRRKLIKPEPLSKKNHMTFCHQASFVKTSLMKELKFDTTYTICSDRDFFWRALKLGCLFQYIPVVICNYEGEKGISTVNRVQMRKESGHIDGSDKRAWWRFKQLILVIVCAISRKINNLSR